VHIAWLTDVHLNFLDRTGREQFAADVALTGADGVVITGDIAEAGSLVPLLEELADAVLRPVWFVLGNHDFYGGSIEAVRASARRLSDEHEWLAWLPSTGVVALSEETALIGVDGWGDARLGNALGTPVELSDFHHIDELRGLSRADRIARLRALGDESAERLRAGLAAALTGARHVVIATHVPPFREACWHEGQVSDDDWLPYFTCDAVGRALREIMAARPERTATVLCGHTHGAGAVDVLPNLRVLTGGAEYGQPVVQRVLAVR
jgi:3',5'-cyclic AMP phosphodiesterase CpdA